MGSGEPLSPTHGCLTPSSFGAAWLRSSLKIKMKIHHLAKRQGGYPFAPVTDLALLLTGKGDLGGFGIFTSMRNKSTQRKALTVVAQENK